MNLHHKSVAQTIPLANQPLRSLLLKHGRDTHKGTFGSVAVLEGIHELAGASRLCAYAAYRAGAGAVTLLTPAKASSLPRQPEVMSLPVRSITAHIDRFTAIVIGPGVGKSAGRFANAKAIFNLALKKNGTIIVDADALPLLLGASKNKRSDATIIATPHPKEAAGLLKLSTEAVQADRLKAALKLASLPINTSAEVIWVLKGADPIVVSKDKAPTVVEGGVPALSVAGSGDVLSGAIAALVAQTSTAFEACLLGVSAHLSAGRMLKTRGHFATEIADSLGRSLWS